MYKRIAAVADLVSMLKLNQRVGIVVSWEIHLQEGPVIYIRSKEKKKESNLYSSTALNK